MWCCLTVNAVTVKTLFVGGNVNQRLPLSADLQVAGLLSAFSVRRLTVGGGGREMW